MRRRGFVFSLCIVLLLALARLSLSAAPAGQADDLSTFAFDARADLELLANVVFGEGVRPDLWTFNADTTSTTFVADLWFDNEQVANQIYGAGVRPPDWLGAAGSTRETIARNVRHDLELAATQQLGLGVRPDGWRGSDPLLRCTRTLQNLVTVLTTRFGVQVTTPASTLNFCAAVELELEDDLLAQIITPERLGQVAAQVLAVRGDLERLADEKLGLGNRPSGWLGNIDPNSTTLAGDAFLDLELLADTLLGAGTRPPGWIGALSNTAPFTAQNLRHDLELLADTTFAHGERPTGWQGVDPLARCVPPLQNLVALAALTSGYTITGIPTNAPDFCLQVDASVNRAIENPPVLDVVEPEPEETRFTAESNYAYTYLDVAATQYMGIMPAGTEFRAWYRNFGGSNMMFVSGLDFAVYVDVRFTTLPIPVFDGLPSLEGVRPETFCAAPWCSGPGPTPTPTGGGALSQVLNAATGFGTPGAVGTPVPAGTPAPDAAKTQVSWNNVRVTYVQDNVEARTARVTLEICSQPAASATSCEPVTSLRDATTGAVRAPVAQSEGRSVYELRYGYSAGLLIEGATLFSNDVWISDPTIR